MLQRFPALLHALVDEPHTAQRLYLLEGLRVESQQTAVVLQCPFQLSCRMTLIPQFFAQFSLRRWLGR